MRPFVFKQPASQKDAIALASGSLNAGTAADHPVQFLAGGTSLIDLMKLDVMRPDMVIDILRAGDAGSDQIVTDNGALRLGAWVKMAAAADHAQLKHEFPVIAQSLALAASAQLRNMASLGGNVLQRTRCTYFRDVSYAACNKRAPGSGCSALNGLNRNHAILGGSDACIATYPGDFALALMALNAEVEISGRNGTTRKSFADLHVLPGQTPDIETTLKQGELIVAFHIPATPFARRSRYVKIRDRDSYAFALVSAAVVLDMDNGLVREARIALGGVASTPWRARDAETLLKGKHLDESVAQVAADAAFASARTHEHNAFKSPLGKAVLVRALLETAAMEI